MAQPTFIWATGIEDTFVTQPHPRTGRTLDEYELTQHYRFWREDLDRAAELGVRFMRYGIPWHRVEPAPGRFEWSWTDRVLEYMVARLGITPIVDLMHYGTPLWLERQFLSPDYPQRVEAYVRAFLERYRSLSRYYTPLNEPSINARYSGLLGIWPPYARSWRGYVQVLLQLCRGIVGTARAIRELVPDAVLVHVEAGAIYRTQDPSLQPQVELRDHANYLGLDLLYGRVTPEHPLWCWLVDRLRVSERELTWFCAEGAGFRADWIGVNYYPQWSTHELYRRGDTLDERLPNLGADGLEHLLRIYHARTGAPVFISECAARGAVAVRARWMDEAIARVCRLHQNGFPVIGYTWWPLFSLVTWTYLRGRYPLDRYLAHMGLWDLRGAPDGTLERRRTPLVDRFREYVLHGLCRAPRHNPL
jgi:beta-glucosidase